MAITAAIAKASAANRQHADLEELVMEALARIAEQVADHATFSQVIISDRGREAVEDRNFARAADNLRHAIAHGSRDQQLAGMDRLVAVHDRDEQAEDLVIRTLLALLAEHNVGTHDLRRLLRDNARAITDGEPVVLSESPTVAIPAALLARQKGVHA